MQVEEQKKKQLEGKIADYRRFGFVLITLSVFLFIGLLIPNESAPRNMSELLIVAVFVLLGGSLVFHRIAVKAEKRLLNEDH